MPVQGAVGTASLLRLPRIKEREKRQGSKDQRRREPGPGRSATVERMSYTAGIAAIETS